MGLTKGLALIWENDDSSSLTHPHYIYGICLNEKEFIRVVLLCILILIMTNGSFPGRAVSES